MTHLCDLLGCLAFGGSPFNESQCLCLDGSITRTPFSLRVLADRLTLSSHSPLVVTSRCGAFDLVLPGPHAIAAFRPRTLCVSTSYGTIPVRLSYDFSFCNIHTFLACSSLCLLCLTFRGRSLSRLQFESSCLNTSFCITFIPYTLVIFAVCQRFRIKMKFEALHGTFKYSPCFFEGTAAALINRWIMP